MLFSNNNLSLAWSADKLCGEIIFVLILPLQKFLMIFMPKLVLLLFLYQEQLD